MSINHPAGIVGSKYTVAPSQQELAAAPNPYGGNILPGAPDPFTQFDARLPGAPAWAGMGGYEQDPSRMPGAPDPNTGTYAPMLPGAPDPFAGYNPMLPGAPIMSVLPSKATEPQTFPIAPMPSYQPQQHQQYDIPTGPVTHDPHWM